MRVQFEMEEFLNVLETVWFYDNTFIELTFRVAITTFKAFTVVLPKDVISNLSNKCSWLNHSFHKVYYSKVIPTAVFDEGHIDKSIFVFYFMGQFF